MQFLKLSSDWMYSPLICRIENRFSGAGVAFYFKAATKVWNMGGSAPVVCLLSLRTKPLRWHDAEAILREFGLFEYDADGYLMLSDRYPENGFIKPKSKFPSYVRTSGAGESVRTTPAGGAVCATGAYDAPVILDELEESIRVEMEAEQKFFSFMHNECPHLLELPEPMNFDQLKQLRQDFSADEIRDVLRDMENKPDLSVRSCYKTARKWLHHRKQ